MERSALRSSAHPFDGVRLEPGAFENDGRRRAVLAVGPIGEFAIYGSAEQMRELAVRALAAAEHADALPEPRPPQDQP